MNDAAVVLGRGLLLVISISRLLVTVPLVISRQLATEFGSLRSLEAIAVALKEDKQSSASNVRTVRMIDLLRRPCDLTQPGNRHTGPSFDACHRLTSFFSFLPAIGL